MSDANVKVPVSRWAVIQRLNRKLAKDGMVLKRSRSQRARLDLGEFYLLDTTNPNVISHHVDLEDYAIEEGVLRQWETLALEETS